MVVADATTLVSEVTKSLNAQLEERLVSFFGPYETAKNVIDNYVLEAYPVNTFLNDDRLGLTISVEYRIRPKTEEEKAADRAAEILRRNVPVGKCIVCNKDVYEHQDHEHTIHGLYHAECIDGRPNEGRETRGY